MSCFIDAGSTTHALAQVLLHRSGIQIVTNSVGIAQELAGNSGLDVILLGGRLAKEMPATYGDQTVAEIGRYRLDIAIVSPVSFDAADGAMDYLWHEAVVARAMFEHARTRFLLAESSKIGRSSRVQICAPAAIAKLLGAGVKRVLTA